jgi:hypothetical protein
LSAPTKYLLLMLPHSMLNRLQADRLDRQLPQAAMPAKAGRAD